MSIACLLKFWQAIGKSGKSTAQVPDRKGTIHSKKGPWKGSNFSMRELQDSLVPRPRFDAATSILLTQIQEGCTCAASLAASQSAHSAGNTKICSRF